MSARLPSLGPAAYPKRLLSVLLIAAAALFAGLAASSLPLAAALLSAPLITAFIWVLWRYPGLGVWLMVVFTIFGETLQRWLPDLGRFAGEAGLIAILMLFLLRQTLTTGRIRFRRSPLDLPLLTFFLVAAASSLLNGVDPVVALLGIRPWLRYLVIFYIILNLDWSDSGQKRLMWALFGIAALEAIIGIAQGIGGQPIAQFFAAPDVDIGGAITQQIDPGLIGARPFGTLARYDRFGNYLMLMLLFGITSLPTVPPSKRLWIYGPLGLMAVALVLSFSRQAWVGTAAGLAVLLWKDRRASSMFLLAVTFTLLMSVFLFVEPSRAVGGDPGEVGLVGRILEPFTEQYLQGQTGVGGRMYYFLVITPKLLTSAPWLGHGPGRFASLVTRLYPTPVYDRLEIPQHFVDFFAFDVQYLAMLGQVGLLGLAAFLWIVAAFMRMAYRQVRRTSNRASFPRALALTGFAWTIAVVLISFLGPNFEVRAVSINYWLLAGLIAVNEVIHENTRPQ